MMATVTIEGKGNKYVTFAEGTDHRLTSGNVTEVISDCLGAGIGCVLVEQRHLSEEFYKLESLEAGLILQKFRTYGIRFAIVVSPKRLRTGRFAEMASEEKKGRWFSAFTEKEEAEKWLSTP